jgi:hypothetical protein
MHQNIKTEAGHIDSSKQHPLKTRALRVSGFISKNKGIPTRRLFWNVLLLFFVLRVSKIFSPSSAKRKDGFVFVACHHKVMTTYFHAVLRILSAGLNLKFQKVNFEQAPQGTDVLLSMQSAFDPKLFGACRGVHLIRDPRDMIVSGYHYHKWTHEPWVHRKDENGRSYQEKLNACSKHDGLFMEIDHFIYIYGDILRKWDIGDPNVLEVQYEQLMGSERRALYEEMFRHLGFADRELTFACRLMELFESESRTGRKTGSEAAKSHIRSGRAGQWRGELAPEHRAYIEAELGDILRKFNYERDGSWVQNP